MPDPAPRPPAVTVRDVGKSYLLYDRPADRLWQFLWRGRRSFGRVFHALSGVSFALERGEALGIVGRNGAGKSTLLQLVCGTLQPTTGSIEVNGRIAALLELGAGFNPEFTGRENVFLNAALLGASEEETRARFPEIVAFSGLADFIDQPVKTYSSGMYVRLAFAVATAFEPDILVIDEALSVGDGAFARKSFERIMGLREQGATILFCSHSTYHVDALCERALWLERGRVRMLDAAQKVTAAYNDFLAGEGSTATGAPTTACAASAGTARITRVTGRAEGIEGRELPIVSRKSTLSITVEFASDPALPCPSVALAIANPAGIGITSTIGFATQGAIVRAPDGQGHATVVFPEIPLLKGCYFVDVYLACERGLQVYDTAPRCLKLEVAQSDALQGLVALPHRWEGAP